MDVILYTLYRINFSGITILLGQCVRYGKFGELSGTLLKYIRPVDQILVAGCGNSDLSADLYDVGYHNVLNVDISSTVIRQMSAKHADTRPDMKFFQMDLLEVCSLSVESYICTVCYFSVQHSAVMTFCYYFLLVFLAVN